jgi:hypothetical protein
VTVVWCVDTSAWIDAVRFYNPASPLFAPLWTFLEEQAMAQRVIAPEAVYRELKEKTLKDSPIFAAFVGRVRDRMFVEHSEEIQARCQVIVNRYPSLTKKGKPFAKSDGDAWVIAVAQNAVAVVVTNEKPKPNAAVPSKMPDVASAEGLVWVQLPEFLNALQGLDAHDDEATEEAPGEAVPAGEPEEQE